MQVELWEIFKEQGSVTDREYVKYIAHILDLKENTDMRNILVAISTYKGRGVTSTEIREMEILNLSERRATEDIRCLQRLGLIYQSEKVATAKYYKITQLGLGALHSLNQN